MKTSINRYAYALAFLLLAGYALVTLRGPRGVHALFDKQTQIQDAEKHNADLARDIERKREHIKRLEDNPAQQDLEIRERLKLAHPNAKIFIIADPVRK